MLPAKKRISGFETASEPSFVCSPLYSAGGHWCGSLLAAKGGSAAQRCWPEAAAESRWAASCSPEVHLFGRGQTSGCDVGWRALILHTKAQKRLCSATRSESRLRATRLSSGGAFSGRICLAAGVCRPGRAQSQPSMSWAVARLALSTDNAGPLKLGKQRLVARFFVGVARDVHCPQMQRRVYS